MTATTSPQTAAPPAGAVDPDGYEAATIGVLFRRLVPFLALLYLFAILDRMNVGFAAVTMNADLGLSARMYGLGAGVFFIGYVICEVPSNVILAQVGARRWISRIMITWGLLSAGMAFIGGPVGFVVLRFLIGIAEAGFFPGIMYYLTCWFPSAHRARVVGLFMVAVPLTNVIGAPVSAAMLQMDGLAGLHGWQWLFLLQGLPAALLGVAVLRWLPDRPRDARWLQPKQAAWLENILEAERAAFGGHDAHGFAAIRAVLLDRRVLGFSLIYMCLSTALYSIGFWMPQMLDAHGLDTAKVALAVAAPNAVGAVAMILWARRSDAKGERVVHAMLPIAVAGLGFLTIGLIGDASLSATVIGFCCVGLVFASYPPFWALPTAFLTGTRAAAGIAMISAVGNLGGLVGPVVIGASRDATGSFGPGMLALAGVMVVGMVLLRRMGKAGMPTP